MFTKIFNFAGKSMNQKVNEEIQFLEEDNKFIIQKLRREIFIESTYILLDSDFSSKEDASIKLRKIEAAPSIKDMVIYFKELCDKNSYQDKKELFKLAKKYENNLAKLEVLYELVD
jgi:hypothetical protein